MKPTLARSVFTLFDATCAPCGTAVAWLVLVLAMVWVGFPRAQASEPDARGLPRHLSETGWSEAAASAAEQGLVGFSPQYPLWSDGALKRRWLYLPPGTFIDAANPDAWEFPRGTKLWKEFRYARAVETRFIERQADGRWRFGTYVWNAQGSDAVLAPPRGLRAIPADDAPGGRYDIPAEADCRACHEAAPAPVLGFSALQLSPDRDTLAPHGELAVSADLMTLVRSGRLRRLPTSLLATAPRIASANARERAAIGYLHGNCGHCHNDDGPLAVLDLNLSVRARQGFTAESVRESLLNLPSQISVQRLPAGSPRLAPGDFSAGVIAHRMRSRDPRQQMPPMGTVLADDDALALLTEWVNGLAAGTRVSIEK